MMKPPRTTLMASLIASAFLGPTSPAVAQRSVVTMAGSLDAGQGDKDYDRASCVLMLKGSPRAAGMNATPIADLNALTTAMTTTGLIDPAVKAALGLGSREWRKVILVEIAPAGSQAVKLTVSVDPKPNELKQPEPAAALLKELIGRAKAVVGQSVEPRRQEVKAKLEELEKRRSESRPIIEALRKRLREAEAATMRGANDFSANQRRQLETELIGKRARLRAVKELTPKFAAQDDLTAALKGLVEARESLVAGLEKAAEQAKASPLEVLRARAELAEARVRAAEQGRIPGSPQSRDVRDDRLGLEVDVATLEAQVKAFAEKEPEQAKPATEDAQSIRTELFRTESENNGLEQQYQQARREYEQLGSPPTLVVLDGQKGE